jgi:hypothetical protein
VKHYPPRPTGHHTGWSPARDRAAQARFRALLIQRSGGQCEYIFPGLMALRCPIREGLQAHHDRAGYTADSGRLLCRDHHKAEDRHAR